MSSIIIPEVEIEIGDNLYLKIKEVSFIPKDTGYISGRPEDSREPQPAECDWKNENAQLVIRKTVFVCTERVDEMTIRKIYRQDEKEFPVDDSFVYEYYNDIITAIEEMKNNE